MKSKVILIFAFPFISLFAFPEEKIRQTIEWNYKMRLESGHFKLYTGSPESVARTILEPYENIYVTFYTDFRDTGMEIPERIKIYLFEEKKEYKDYMLSKGMARKNDSETFSHYSSYSGVACFFRLGQSKEYLYQSVAHEITRSLSISLFKSLYGGGVWTIECIAYYMQMSMDWKKMRVIPGEIHQTKNSQIVNVIKAMQRLKKIRPLRDLISMGYSALNDPTLQIQAFSLFHFLQEANDGKHKTGLHRYPTEICTGRGSGVEVFERYVGRISELEPEYLEYIHKLKPKKEPHNKIKTKNLCFDCDV